MKLLKAVPATVMLVGGMLASLNAAADDSIFTVVDNLANIKKPFEGNPSAGYLAQSGNTKGSSFAAGTIMTRYRQATAQSPQGDASNTSSNDECSSEKYAAGGYSRFNLADCDYLFGQASWLTDRYNDYQERDILTAGYGRQFLNGPIHSFHSEFSPGVRYDKYTGNASETQLLGYVSRVYAWQLTDNTKFTQGVSVSGAEDATLNPESALNVAISKHFGLKVACNVT